LCNGDSFFVADTWQNATGTYPQIYSASNGCDSLVKFVLDFLSVFENPPTDLVLCEGDSAFLAGAWQTSIGLYTDTLIAASGCDSLVAIALGFEFCPPPPDTCILQLPNAFSPNGDGINDAFGLPQDRCTLLGEIELLLFNRWGEQIWWTNDPWQQWDGTFNGKPQELGVYVWFLSYTELETNTSQRQRGTVTLAR
jgi:gliding motility-associated-like protein